MVERIVVGVDGSQGSVRALRWALGEAVARRAVLEPVTVWQSPYDFGEELLYPAVEETIVAGAKEQLDRAVAELFGDDRTVVLEGTVLHGDAAQTLCDRSAHADLLVVGSRGHGGFAGLLLGSVSTKCAHHSGCPVVIVPKAGLVTTSGPGPGGRIVVGVDGSEGSRRALRWAAADAELRGWSIDAVAVWHDPYGGEMSLEFQAPYFRRDRLARLEHVEAQLAEAVAEAAAAVPAVEIDPVVVDSDGDPAATLCDRSAEADLLVVGSRGHGGFAQLLLGSVSSACAHHSRCPIVIVPAPRPDVDAPSGT
ncbi:MAG: universal stress protein [Acidimicrobiales bacterium]